jgi:hypothetical protein
VTAYSLSQWHWSVVPVRLDKAFSHGFYDPFFDGAKHETVCDFTFADDWFNTNTQVRHRLEGEPNAIGWRRLDAKE